MPSGWVLISVVACYMAVYWGLHNNYKAGIHDGFEAGYNYAYKQCVKNETEKEYSFSTIFEMEPTLIFDPSHNVIATQVKRGEPKFEKTKEKKEWKIKKNLENGWKELKTFVQVSWKKMLNMF
jgi:hypothetical protein